MSIETGKKRQAVIVIHGIGEQYPMSTLRDFVSNVIETKADTHQPQYYSKPDLFSNIFDLRCLVTPGNTRPRTDFFEFYWAHLMPKANWPKVFNWIVLLINRNRKDVPPQFRSLWWMLWGSLGMLSIAIVMSVVNLFINPQHEAEIFLKIPFGLAMTGLFLQGLFLSYIGDAATYLSPHPQNVASRYAIRSAGVALLDNLHKSGNYDRIIIVGHSLGSLIGYDILSYTWHRYQKQFGSAEKLHREHMQQAESFAKKRSQMFNNKENLQTDFQEQWATLTRQVGKEMRTNQHAWLVTDFVTLGSPLAHADFLMANSREDFNRKVEQRELAVSPPVMDLKGTFSNRINYILPDGSKRSTFVPHHAAWSACVCWTNLYFPCQWLLKGDVVGGPLAPLFGAGVHDIAVSTKNRNGWLAHTLYWTKDSATKDARSDSIRNLRLALDLTGKGYRPD